MNTNQKKVTGTIASLTAAATLAAGGLGLMANQKTEIPYKVNVVNQYVSELVVEPPEDESVDLITLYLGDGKISSALLPNETLKLIPLMLTDMDNLRIECYQQGEIIGEITFDDKDKCYYTEK